MEAAFQPTGRGAAAEPSPSRVSLLTNGVTWYLRSSLSLDGGRLGVVTPRTFLGFLPIGNKRLDLDTADLQRTALGTKLHPERLIVAAAFIFYSVFGNLGTFGTVVMGLGAVAMLLLSFIAVMRFEGSGRRPFTVPICLAHIPRARRFADAVRQAARPDSEAGP